MNLVGWLFVGASRPLGRGRHSGRPTGAAWHRSPASEELVARPLARLTVAQPFVGHYTE